MSRKEVKKLTDLARNIKRFREDAGLTQVELAGKIGVEQPAIAKYEKATSEPKNVILVALAEALGVSTDALLGRT